MTQPETCSFAEFAAIAGFRRKSYVTQLRKDGRLVLTDDGKRVRVAESLARLEATRDPAHAGVAARHAAERAAAQVVAAPTPAASASAVPVAEADGGEDEPEINASGFTYWRERNEKAKALSAERENAVAEGKLLVAADVELELARAAAQLRTSLEAMAHDLAPELAPLTDEGQVRAKLADYVEHALHDLSRRFAALGRQEVA